MSPRRPHPLDAWTPHEVTVFLDHYRMRKADAVAVGDHVLDIRKEIAPALPKPMVLAIAARRYQEHLARRRAAEEGT